MLRINQLYVRRTGAATELQIDPDWFTLPLLVVLPLRVVIILDEEPINDDYRYISIRARTEQLLGQNNYLAFLPGVFLILAKSFGTNAIVT